MFGKQAAQGQLLNEINNMVGTQGGQAIQEMIKSASKPSSGIIASIIGFLTLIFGASSVAGELKASVNVIWDLPVKSGGVKEMIKQRSTALAVILGCGFLLLVSLVVSSAISAAGKFVADMLPMPELVLQVLGFVLSFAVITGVFAVLLKYLPDVHVEWRDVLAGAAFTALLFTIGEYLIGMYLGKAGFASTYGAAGSLVIVLVWVYYSSQIFFFGAEFTQVYSNEYGSRPLKQSRRRSRLPPASWIRHAAVRTLRWPVWDRCLEARWCSAESHPCSGIANDASSSIPCRRRGRVRGGAAHHRYARALLRPNPAARSSMAIED